MRAIVLEGGKLLVPRRAEMDGVVGDGTVEIDNSDDEWAAWAATLTPEDQAVLSSPGDALSEGGRKPQGRYLAMDGTIAPRK